jgi:hypothetical protein
MSAVRVDLALLAVALEHLDVGACARLVEDADGYLARDRVVGDFNHHVGGDVGQRARNGAVRCRCRGEPTWVVVHVDGFVRDGELDGYSVESEYEGVAVFGLELRRAVLGGINDPLAFLAHVVDVWFRVDSFEVHKGVCDGPTHVGIADVVALGACLADLDEFVCVRDEVWVLAILWLFWVTLRKWWLLLGFALWILMAVGRWL